MSELGSNKGQDENKNTTVFDSSNLAEKQNTEHFAKVEGAEARKKAAEREVKAAEKKAEEAHKDAVKNAAKKANKEAKGSKGGILRFLFGGWHKIVTVTIILLLIAGSSIILGNINRSNNETIKRDQEAVEMSAEKYREAETKRLNGSYENAKKVFEDSLERCSREEKIFLTIEYAKYIAKYQYDAETAYSLLSEIKAEAKNDYELREIESGHALIEVYTGVEYEK